MIRQPAVFSAQFSDSVGFFFGLQLSDLVCFYLYVCFWFLVVAISNFAFCLGFDFY